jgi:tetratricopeptide (TPR) repeat protein
MSLTPLELKNQGNEYYSNNQSSLAIESYTKAIELLQINPEESLPLYLLYSNRSAAYIQEKNFYDGYEDAKESLKLKKDGNLKGFYRAAVCSYHLGFIKKSKEFIKEATEDHHQNLLDYLNLKLSIEKKVKRMNKYRKANATAKASLNHLKKIIQKNIPIGDTAAILYHIRYLLRAFFDNIKDKKLMNMDYDDLGVKLHQLAMKFNSKFKVEVNIQFIKDLNICFFLRN